MSAEGQFALDSVVEKTMWLDEVDSTNAYLIGQNTNDSAILLSWNQTQGRGRLGREWVSPEGGSLALSVAIWPEIVPQSLTPEWLGAVSLVTGASLADALRPHLATPVRVKWPNDVLVGGKKVAGVLGEVTSDSRVIVGVGLNVLLTESQLPTPLSTSLALHGFRANLETVVSAFLRELRVSLTGLEGGLSREKRAWVSEQCDTIGSEVRVELPGGVSRLGRATELDYAGRLLVHFSDTDTVETVDAADVIHLRPAN